MKYNMISTHMHMYTALESACEAMLLPVFVFAETLKSSRCSIFTLGGIKEETKMHNAHGV